MSHRGRVRTGAGLVFLLSFVAIAPRGASQSPPCEQPPILPNSSQGAWPEGTRVQVWVDPAMSDDLYNAAKAGVQSWARAGGSGVTFNVMKNSGFATPPKGAIGISRTDLGGLAGQTTRQPSYQGLEWARVEIDFGQNKPGLMESTVAHEIGHTFSLGDCETALCRANSIMGTSTAITKPSQCDKDAVRQAGGYTGKDTTGGPGNPDGPGRDCRKVDVCVREYDCGVEAGKRVCVPTGGCLYYETRTQCAYGLIDFSEPGARSTCDYIGWYGPESGAACAAAAGQPCIKKDYCAFDFNGDPVPCQPSYCWKPPNGPGIVPIAPETSGPTCSSKGWFNGDQGDQCNAACGQACVRKQDCGGLPCWPSYCWKCASGEPSAGNESRILGEEVVVPVLESRLSAAPLETLTVTVSDGPAKPRDWLGIYPVSAADTGFVDWKYLNGSKKVPETGMTGAAVTFEVPPATGSYNFRFFRDNEFASLGLSQSVSVQSPAGAALNVTPLVLDFGDVHVGSWASLSVTIRSVGASTLTGTIAVTGGGFSIVGSQNLNLPPGASASVEVRLTPPAMGAQAATLTVVGGSGAQLPLRGVGIGSASITPSLLMASPNQNISVRVGGGPGTVRDWIGLFAPSAVDTSFLDWKYLNGSRTVPTSGSTDATVAFNMPSTPGSYELRFFQNGGYARLAIASVKVATPMISILSATTVNRGDTVRVWVQYGPGSPTAWVGLHTTAAADTLWTDWKYLNGTRTAPAAGLTSAMLTFTAPSTAGVYNFRFFQDSGYVKLGTSQSLTVH